MEQSQYTTVAQPEPYQQETKLRAPIFVKIIGGLVLIQGIYTLFFVSIMIVMSMLLFIIDEQAQEAIFLAIIPVLIQGAGLVAVSFGIRNMRLWALYSFTLLLILIVGFFFFSLLIMETKNLTPLFRIGLGIDVLALVYLWSIYKKFK